MLLLSIFVKGFLCDYQKKAYYYPLTRSLPPHSSFGLLRAHLSITSLPCLGGLAKKITIVASMLRAANMINAI